MSVFVLRIIAVLNSNFLLDFIWFSFCVLNYTPDTVDSAFKKAGFPGYTIVECRDGCLMITRVTYNVLHIRELLELK